MNTQERARMEAARKVMKLLRLQDFRTSVSEASVDGRTELVVALPTDTLGYVSRKVVQSGGRAAVVVAFETGARVMVMEDDRTSSEESSDGPVHQNSEISFLVRYMDTAGKRSMEYHLVSGDARVQLLDARPDDARLSRKTEGAAILT